MNPGKRFEEDFHRSIPEDVYCYRIPDPVSRTKSGEIVFGKPVPFDFFVFKSPVLYALELKSTDGTSIGFDGVNPMIKAHQIEELHKVTKFEQIKAGFILNFRQDHSTYFLPIEKFYWFRDVTGKKSINRKDLDTYGVYIPSWVIRTRIHYDLSPLLGGE